MDIRNDDPIGYSIVHTDADFAIVIPPTIFNPETGVRYHDGEDGLRLDFEGGSVLLAPFPLEYRQNLGAELLVAEDHEMPRAYVAVRVEDA